MLYHPAKFSSMSFTLLLDFSSAHCGIFKYCYPMPLIQNDNWIQLLPCPAIRYHLSNWDLRTMRQSVLLWYGPSPRRNKCRSNKLPYPLECNPGVLFFTRGFGVGFSSNLVGFYQFRMNFSIFLFFLLFIQSFIFYWLKTAKVGALFEQQETNFAFGRTRWGFIRDGLVLF